MDLTDLPMLNIPLNFGNDGDFDFNGLPTGWSSGSISGSSYASSSFGPHTPTSGRSSPPFSTSFDFGSSFASSVDTVPFDLTPPSSATSTYFPMTPKTGPVSDFVYPGFPATPSRGQLDFSGLPLSSCATQLTPSQTMDMDCSFAINQLGLYPQLATPSPSAQYDHLSSAASHWMYPDSPIRFEQLSPTRLTGAAQLVKQGPQSVKQEPQESPMTPMTPSTPTRKRALMDEARNRTTALQQQVRQCSPSPTRPRIKREKKRRTFRMGDGSFAADNIEPASSYKCPVEGCSKRYRRSEHMKRHVHRYVLQHTQLLLSRHGLTWAQRT